jgi:hypothetical protein
LSFTGDFVDYKNIKPHDLENFRCSEGFHTKNANNIQKNRKGKIHISLVRVQTNKPLVFPLFPIMSLQSTGGPMLLSSLAEGKWPQWLLLPRDYGAVKEEIWRPLERGENYRNIKSV